MTIRQWDEDKKEWVEKSTIAGVLMAKKIELNYEEFEVLAFHLSRSLKGYNFTKISEMIDFVVLSEKIDSLCIEKGTKCVITKEWE
jgi:hypothetical protein